MNTRSIVVLSAGLGQPSSTRLLADRLAGATSEQLAGQGIDAAIRVIEIRDLAHDIMNNLLTGFAPAPLTEALAALEAADGVIAVSPIFSTSYSGLFKSFIDVIDRDALTGKPVLLAATAGTARHSLAVDYAMRPLFTYLHADPVPTAVFAATADWGDKADTVGGGLPARIERGARELANRMAGTSAPVARKSEFEDYVPFGELLG